MVVAWTGTLAVPADAGRSYPWCDGPDPVCVRRSHRRGRPARGRWTYGLEAVGYALRNGEPADLAVAGRVGSSMKPSAGAFEPPKVGGLAVFITALARTRVKRRRGLACVLQTGFARADPLATLVLAALMAACCALIRESGRMILEAAPASWMRTRSARRWGPGPPCWRSLPCNIQDVTSGFPASPRTFSLSMRRTAPPAAPSELERSSPSAT